MTKHLNTVRKSELIVLYALLKGYKINLGKIIENSIMSYYKRKYKGLIPCPSTIARLCILWGLNRDCGDEETCP